MRCLVTGEAGFIGFNLVDSLIKRGDRVTVLDNLSTGKEANLEAAIAAGARLDVADIRDGRQTRDWVEVGEVVRANLLAAEAGVEGPVNIAQGRETSVLELIDALRQVSRGGALPDPDFASERRDEVRRSCLDMSRAREALAWVAEAELQAGLRRILETLDGGTSQVGG